MKVGRAAVTIAKQARPLTSSVHSDRDKNNVTDVGLILGRTAIDGRKATWEGSLQLLLVPFAVHSVACHSSTAERSRKTLTHAV